jgi:hypothetical protein
MIFYFYTKNWSLYTYNFKSKKNTFTGADIRKKHSLSEFFIAAVCTADSRYSTGTGTRKKFTQCFLGNTTEVVTKQSATRTGTGTQE